jgi:DNA-binding transcriptional regulator YhcF (GntR family)
MELEWEPPSKRVMSSEEEVKLHTVEKKVAYDERHDIIEKKRNDLFY